MAERPSFPSPEAAALSAWAHTPAAAARVVEVRPSADDHAVCVVLQLGNEPTGIHDLDIVTGVRQDDGTWIEGGSTGGSSA